MTIPEQRKRRAVAEARARVQSVQRQNKWCGQRLRLAIEERGHDMPQFYDARRFHGRALVRAMRRAP